MPRSRAQAWAPRSPSLHGGPALPPDVAGFDVEHPQAALVPADPVGGAAHLELVVHPEGFNVNPFNTFGGFLSAWTGRPPAMLLMRPRRNGISCRRGGGKIIAATPGCMPSNWTQSWPGSGPFPRRRPNLSPLMLGKGVTAIWIS